MHSMMMRFSEFEVVRQSSFMISIYSKNGVSYLPWSSSKSRNAKNTFGGNFSPCEWVHNLAGFARRTSMHGKHGACSWYKVSVRKEVAPSTPAQIQRFWEYKRTRAFWWAVQLVCADHLQTAGIRGGYASTASCLNIAGTTLPFFGYELWSLESTNFSETREAGNRVTNATVITTFWNSRFCWHEAAAVYQRNRAGPCNAFMLSP